jgi:hypothetical protein
MTTTTYLKIIVLSFLFLPQVLFAASLGFNENKVELGVGGKIKVPLTLNTEGTPINAFEGSYSFDPEFLTPTAILDGDSIVSTWIKSADLHDAAAKRGSILFSGIIPKGTNAVGNVITILFTASKAGSTHIAGAGIAYKNDGKGTPIVLSPLQMNIEVKGTVSKTEEDKASKDTTPPIITRLDIVQNEAMFDGAYFIVFAGKDEGSGIDHFELLEKSSRESIIEVEKDSDFKVIKNPSPLSDQTLASYVYLKAVDREGNFSIKELRTRADLSPQARNSWFKNPWTLGILIVTVFGILFFFYHRRQGLTHESY